MAHGAYGVTSENHRPESPPDRSIATLVRRRLLVRPTGLVIPCVSIAIDAGALGVASTMSTETERSRWHQAPGLTAPILTLVTAEKAMLRSPLASL